MFKRPMFLWAIIAFVISVLCFNFRKLSLLIAITLLILIPVFVYFRKYIFVFPVLLCFLITLNILSVYTETDRTELISKSVVTADFVATSDAVSEEKYSFIELKSLSGSEIPEGISVSTVYYGKSKIKAGDIINASVKLETPDSDNKSYYYGEGIYFRGILKNINRNFSSDLFYKTIGDVRRYVIKSDKQFLEGDTAALLIAVTIGDKSYLSEKVSLGIKSAGVSHMMAVSGLHLAIILGSLFGLFERFIRNKYLKVLVSVIAVLFIIAVCGFTKSIIRAGLMYVIAAVAPLFNRDSDPLNSLGLSLILILLVSPFASESIALQLSFLSTFAVIYISPVLCEFTVNLFEIKNKFVLKITEIIILTVSATVATAPVVIKNFGYISAVNVFANLFLIYLLSGALSLNVISLIIPYYIYPLRFIVFKLAGLFSWMMVKIIEGFSELTFALVKTGEAAFIIYVLIFAAFIVFADVYRLKNKKEE